MVEFELVILEYKSNIVLWYCHSAINSIPSYIQQQNSIPSYIQQQARDLSSHYIIRNTCLKLAETCQQGWQKIYFFIYHLEYYYILHL